ncbi:MAG TPA: DMT family transporter [Amycolatopsis sp.]|nr:DMT family transporter [Amycolatopsis sp.]
MLIPVVLGFVAAFLFAASAALQRSAVLKVADADVEHRASRHRIPILYLIRGLLHRRVWLAGWVTNLGGFLCQAAALHYGSIALVQPLLVTQLLFALPMASAAIRQWPALRDWLAALAISGGVAVFLTVEGAAPLEGSPDRGRLLLAVAVAAAAVVTLVQVAQGRGPLMHSALIASGAGVCYAISAAMMKVTTDDLINRGVLDTALDWPGYVLALSTLTGLLLGQQAYGSGSLSAAIAVMSIVNPAVSYALGLLAFHAVLAVTPAPLAASAGAALLLVLGVFGLAHSPTVQQETTRTATHGVYPHADRLPAEVATPAQPQDTCPQE